MAKLVQKTGKDGRDYFIEKKKGIKGETLYGLKSRDEKGVERAGAYVKKLSEITEKFNKA